LVDFCPNQATKLAKIIETRAADSNLHCWQKKTIFVDSTEQKGLSIQWLF
jgi:hypothetical protein